MPSLFDPNAIGRPNGNYFALPYTVDEAEIVLLSIPWDATVSYGTGTNKAPEAIIEASTQVDLYDVDVASAWKIKIGTIPIEDTLRKLNNKTRRITTRVIEELGSGVAEEALQTDISAVNKSSDELNDYVYNESKKYLSKNKIVAVVGGEHSVPFGLIKALSEEHKNIGILHIDAHADLREAYEGFIYSHASIMYNVMRRLKNIDKLVQVGIRDYCYDEATLISSDSRILTYTDMQLKEAEFNGITWARQCRDIIGALPDKVYISFDVDGLTPDNSPHTGTPVPGGLTYSQAVYLLKILALSGKKIVGFDLCEVTPYKYDEWDANVGARLLYKLCCYTRGIKIVKK